MPFRVGLCIVLVSIILGTLSHVLLSTYNYSMLTIVRRSLGDGTQWNVKFFVLGVSKERVQEGNHSENLTEIPWDTTHEADEI